MPNGIFEGGMLPPVVVKGTRVLGGDDPFDPYGFNFNNLSRFDDVLDQYDSGVGGGGGDLTTLPPAIKIGDGTIDDSQIPYKTEKSGDPVIDAIEEKRLADINEGRRRKGLPDLSVKEANATYRVGDDVRSIARDIRDDTQKELFRLVEQQNAASALAGRTAARTSAATGNSGIPLVIPIPGLDPATGLAITAAGLIFSGGNVAKLDPTNPIQSVVNAGQGMINTGSNAVDVITGQKDISDIWGSGSTGGSGTGSGAGAGSGAGSGAGGNAGTGSIVGGQNQVIGLDPASMGTIGLLGTGGSSGTSQTPAGGGSVAVTPGALGGATAGQTQTRTIPAGGVIVPASSTVPNQTAGTNVMGPIFSTTDIAARQAEQQRQNKAAEEEAVRQQNIYTVGINQRQSDADAQAASLAEARATRAAIDAANAQVVANNARVAIVGNGGDVKNNTTNTTAITGTGTGTGTSTTASTTPIVKETFTFTSPTNSGLAQRDYGKEFGLTAQTLTGKPGDDLAAYYKQLQAQFTPSSLTTLGREAESQLAADLARYNEAQRGNLSQEDVRTAQQGAREAYAARGQVMGQGAIGAEILGRDALQRQREAEARASVQQSMGNLTRAADLQTGNIFSPFASLISQTYSPTNQYAREVYDYNVNAYNAYQAAQQNLAAYKEAASKGQEAQFINSFVGFLANNGIQTTTSAVTSIINGLLGGGAKKPAGT